jgi:hypothetical protein
MEKWKNIIAVSFSLFIFILSVVLFIKLNLHPIVAVLIGLFDGAIALFAAVTFLFTEEDMNNWEAEAIQQDKNDKR